MIYLPFTITAVAIAFLAARYQWKSSRILIPLHPFLLYFIFSELYIKLVDQGPGVTFYWFGYLTLCMPMALLSSIVYLFVRAEMGGRKNANG